MTFEPSPELVLLPSNSEIFVPNIASSFCGYMIERAVHSNVHLLIKGQRGYGKSSSIRQAIKSFTLPLSLVRIHMIKETDSLAINRMIQTKVLVDKKNELQAEVLVPIEGDRLIVLVDNVAMANEECQEYLRSFLETRMHLAERSLENRLVRNCSVVC